MECLDFLSSALTGMPLYIGNDADTQHKACKVSVLTAMSLKSTRHEAVSHSSQQTLMPELGRQH